MERHTVKREEKRDDRDRSVSSERREERQRKRNRDVTSSPSSSNSAPNLKSTTKKLRTAESVDPDQHVKTALDVLQASLQQNKEEILKLMKNVEKNEKTASRLSNNIERTRENPNSSRELYERRKFSLTAVQNDLQLDKMKLTMLRKTVEEQELVAGHLSAHMSHKVGQPSIVEETRRDEEQSGEHEKTREQQAGGGIRGGEIQKKPSLMSRYRPTFGLPQKSMLLNVLKKHPMVWPETKTEAHDEPAEAALEAEWRAICEEFNVDCYDDDRSQYIDVPKLKLETADFHKLIQYCWLPAAYLSICEEGSFTRKQQEVLLTEAIKERSVYGFGYPPEEVEESWKTIWRKFNQKWYKQKEETEDWEQLDKCKKIVNFLFEVTLARAATPLFGEPMDSDIEDDSDNGSENDDSNSENNEEEERVEKKNKEKNDASSV